MQSAAVAAVVAQERALHGHKNNPLRGAEGSAERRSGFYRQAIIVS
ncbi:MAG: hypothetical protein IKN52_04925 [Victivallales bacterium]|nr:hypothetical protein [Victivallales bacterium]